MKKYLALILAALMISLLAIPAFAGAQDEVDMGNVKFGIKKANQAWKADGVINDGEYYEVPMKDTWFSYAWNDLSDGAEDLAKSMGQKLYMSWDDTYVYVATTYKTSKFYNEYGDDAGNIWQACAIQNNFSPRAEEVTANDKRLEYGLSLTSDTNQLVSFVWADSSDGNTGWAPTTEDFIVKNDNNLLTYESRTPWTAFLAAAPKTGDVFGFCIVWAAGPEYGEYIHAQLASGCTGNQGKNAYNFAQVTLEAAPVVETEAPAVVETPVETPASTPAPQTTDALAVVIFAALVTAGGAVALTKKRGK